MIRIARLPLGLSLCLSWLAACTEPAAVAPAGAISGEVEVRIIDHFDGTSERSYRLKVQGRKHGLRLAFDKDPALAPGTELAVWGASQGEAGEGGMRVVGYETLRLPQDEDSAFEANQRALIGAPAFPKRKLAFVLVDLGRGVNINMEQAKAKAFGMGPMDQSIRQVVLEYSSGRFEVDGDVLGPFTTTMTGCDEDGLADSLEGMIPAGYDNIVYYLGQRVDACRWAGVAPLGRAGRPAGKLWVNATASCRVATHEFGHNLGLQHAARLRCTGAAMLDDTSKCTSSEYGDSADVMGDGCNHFNAYSKAYLTWFEKCNGVVAKSSGSYTLLPMESACDGPQVLFVPMTKTRTVGGTALANYSLELRAPLGLDSRFNPPTVLVHLVAPVASMRSARMTWIIDTKPATTTIDGLRQGESFMDPAGGVGFTVEAISATSATIKVTVPEAMAMGGATCLDGTPFTPPGSLTCANFSGTPTAPGPVSDAGAMPGPADAGAPVADSGAGGSSGNPGTGGRSAGSGGNMGSAAGGDTGSGGRPGSGGSGASTGGTPATTTPPPAESGGCGCDVGGSGRSPALALLAVAMMLGLVLRRR